MDDVAFLKKHTFCTTSGSIAEIVAPFLKTCRLSYFDYIRVIGSEYAGLCTDGKWAYHHFSSKYPLGGLVLQQSGVYLFKDYVSERCLQDSIAFNQHNRILVLRKNEHMSEYFGFAANHPDHSLITFYINHIDLFEQFILYFRDKADYLIKQAYDDRFVIPKQCLRSSRTLQIQEITQDWHKIINTQKIRVTIDQKSVILSRREWDCLKHLSRGETMKEVAFNLGISAKTVENHLFNARQKANCSTSKLIGAFHNYFAPNNTAKRILLPEILLS